MTAGSPLTNLLFMGLVAVMALLFRRATAAAFSDRPSGTASLVFLAVALDLLLVFPGLFACLGYLDRYDTRPPVALLPVLAATLLTVGIAISGIGARFSRLPLSGLVGYQVFRVAVEWLLHRLYVEGVVPVQMTFHGRNFDIVSGITGGLLGLWLMKRPASRFVIMLWNCLGLALLVNIVTVAVLSAPVPFRTFVEEPANRLPSLFPYVWLPTFLVQSALFGHLVVFRAALRPRRG